jgi:diketogulonate reductase-like aldo/keto reductase
LPQSGAHSSSARAWSTDDPDRARVFAAGEHRAAVEQELNVLNDAPAWLKWSRDGRPAPEWLEWLTAVRGILQGGGRSLAAGALGWILGRSVRTVPIPGFRTVAQVEDNLGAHEHGPLSADELRQVEELLS